jgi:peroxiredoxin
MMVFMRLIAALLLACAMSSSCTSSTSKMSSGQVVAIAERVPAPHLSGTTLDGHVLDLSTLRGKVLVLNFWASWCGACSAEARSLNRAYEQTEKLGVEFVGINLKDSRSGALSMQRGKDVAYPSIEDERGALLLRFRGQAPQSPPSTFILDRRGRIAVRFLRQIGETELIAAVTRVAAEPA